MGGHGRHIVWQSLDSPGLEHVRVRSEGDQIVAQGRAVRTLRGALEDLRWRVECDPAWRTLSIRVLRHRGLQPLLAAESDARGRWTVQAGNADGKLTGCVDVDLAVTPFTNMLPLRRLGPWRRGEEVRVRVVRADPETGVFVPLRQSYTLLGEDTGGRRFRYRNLDSGSAAVLTVDAEGFVIEHEGRFRRTWSG